MNSIDAQELRERFRQQGFGYLTLDVYEQLASTQNTLQQRSASADIHGHVVIAGMQTGGKGRRGKTWVSPASGNLYTSIGWRWSLSQAAIGTLSLAVGCAIADALEADFGVSLQLKWPNDLMVNDKKLGGILIDLMPRDEALVSIIGIGLNVAMTNPMATTVDQAWTDLHTLMHDTDDAALPDTHQVAASVIVAVVRALEQFRAGGFELWRSRWQQRDILLGKALRIAAQETWFGRGAGIADDGALLVETGQGCVPVYAGDVSVRRALPEDGHQ